jgi:hypothetical protein
LQTNVALAMTLLIAAFGMDGGFQWPLLVIDVSADVALFRFRAGVIPTILACGMAGPLYHSLTRAHLWWAAI